MRDIMIIAAAVMLLGVIVTPGMAIWETRNNTTYYIPPVFSTNDPWAGSAVYVGPIDTANNAGRMTGFDDPWMNIDTRGKFMNSENIKITNVVSSYNLTEEQMKNIPLSEEQWLQWV